MRGGSKGRTAQNSLSLPGSSCLLFAKITHEGTFVFGLKLTILNELCVCYVFSAVTGI